MTTNTSNSAHGHNAQEALEYLLIRCKQAKYIKQYHCDYRIGRKGYSNTQFYTPFLVEFIDNTKWALFSTTSMRTDRIKGQQWDAYNLKELDPSIESVYLVYPDGLLPNIRSEFVRQNNKYLSKSEYSIINRILSQTELYTLIEQKGLSFLSEGAANDKEGRNYEKLIADTLSFEGNLKKWKQITSNYAGVNYNQFLSIVTAFNLNPDDVYSILATADKEMIGLLPSGGQPKTDVLVVVQFNDKKIKPYTLSCKKSSAQFVSVHQYPASTFSRTLDPNNLRLRNLLEGFQKVGGIRAFGKENSEALTRELEPYKRDLALWVLGGIGGDGNAIQTASHILTYNKTDDAFSIYTIEEYYNKLLQKGVSGQFGTVFNWTYASGELGKSIQLKTKIL